MSAHFLPVNEYAHLKVKFRFEKYTDDCESYTLHFTLDDGKTWKEVERFTYVSLSGRLDPKDGWGPKLIFIDEIDRKLEKWKKSIVTYSDLYNEFIATDVHQYERALAEYEAYQAKVRNRPAVINGF